VSFLRPSALIEVVVYFIYGNFIMFIDDFPSFIVFFVLYYSLGVSDIVCKGNFGFFGGNLAF